MPGYSDFALIGPVADYRVVRHDGLPVGEGDRVELVLDRDDPLPRVEVQDVGDPVLRIDVVEPEAVQRPNQWANIARRHRLWRGHRLHAMERHDRNGAQQHDDRGGAPPRGYYLRCE